MVVRSLGSIQMLGILDIKIAMISFHHNRIVVPGHILSPHIRLVLVNSLALLASQHRVVNVCDREIIGLIDMEITILIVLSSVMRLNRLIR